MTWNASLKRRTMLGGLPALALATSASGARAQDWTSGPITLGLVAPLSEPGDARSGQAIRQTAELWVKTTNDAGGISGRKVALAIYDDAGKVEVGAQGAERAITEKHVSALLGMWSSSVTLAEMDIAKRYNVPMMAFYSWSDEVTSKNYPQVFRIGPYNSKIAEQTAEFVRKRSYTNVVMMAEDTAYGLGFAKSFVAAAKALPGVRMETVQFQAQTQDLTPVMSRIAASAPDAVIVQTVFAATNLSIKQGREVGLQSDIIAGWDWPTLADFWPTVGEAGVGVIYPTFNDPSLKRSAVGDTFVAAYKASTGAEPAIFQYYLWDNFNAIKAAIEKAGTAEPAKLVETLPSVDFDGTIGRITFKHDKGTVNFNQWDEFAMFFKQMAKMGDGDKDAKLLFSSTK